MRGAREFSGRSFHVRCEYNGGFGSYTPPVGGKRSSVSSSSSICDPFM